MFDEYIGIDLPQSGHIIENNTSVFADACHLPFDKDIFDFALTIGALYMFDDPGRACREIYRCLRPGGKYLVIDYTVDVKINALKKNLDKGIDRTFHFWKGNELGDLLRYSGFIDSDRQYVSLKSKLLSKLRCGIVDRRDTWLIYTAIK